MRHDAFDNAPGLGIRSMSELGQSEILVKGQSVSALPHDSDVDLFRDDKGIVHFNAEIPYGALDLLVA
jgi:hypothetical protein